VWAAQRVNKELGRLALIGPCSRGMQIGLMQGLSPRVVLSFSIFLFLFMFSIFYFKFELGSKFKYAQS
jgi:hypothetical protein